MRRTSKFLAIAIITVFTLLPFEPAVGAATPSFRLGNEVLYSRYHHLIEGKRVGLITNRCV